MQVHVSAKQSRSDCFAWKGNVRTESVYEQPIPCLLKADGLSQGVVLGRGWIRTAIQASGTGSVPSSPRSGRGVRELTVQQLCWLQEGLKINQPKAPRHWARGRVNQSTV